MTAPTWSNERRKLSALIPWPRNPRQIKGESVRRLQESFEEFGQPEVIAVGPSNEVYNGHQRLKSWLAKFGDIEVDVRVASRPLTEKERERLTVLLHRGAVGEWDFETLANEFEVDELLEWGFTEMELGLDALPAGNADAEPQVDRAAELNEKWQVEPGQLWRIGEHRLICGDCTDASVVTRVMGGEKAGACVTDPPYGTASDGKVQKRGERIETFNIEWDRDAPLEWIPLLGDCLDDGAAVVSFWDNKEITTLWNTLESNGFNPLQTVYWKKTTVPQPRPNFCSSIESAVFARKQGRVLCWNGGGATPNVFEANRAAGNERTEHETQKPLTLFSWLIELVTNVGFVVFDPFSGSGTTMIACENLGRRCRAAEISPGYVAVALERMATAFPGIVIERMDGDGRT